MLAAWAYFHPMCYVMVLTGPLRHSCQPADLHLELLEFIPLDSAGCFGQTTRRDNVVTSCLIAAKAGLLHFVWTMAEKFEKDHHIRLCALCPARADTPLVRHPFASCFQDRGAILVVDLAMNITISPSAPSAHHLPDELYPCWTSYTCFLLPSSRMTLHQMED